MDRGEMLEALYRAVLSREPEEVARAVEEAIGAGLDPLTMIEEGLARGLREVGDLYGRGEAFLADLIMAGEAMKEGLRLLEPLIRRKGGAVRGRVLLGTVEGDHHDIGKNIVVALLRANGFEVIDLGVDVPVEEFVEAVRRFEPDILGLSALMTTTVPLQRRVIERLEELGLRDKVKVLVGGGAVTPEMAREMGADAYGRDALDAVKKAIELIKRR
ncbi:corrinoid protein [Candidatus Bathyarchaeota archaeon]|nr:corrinoid protein [Candidatus Bathyarchaeota archaeon]